MGESNEEVPLRGTGWQRESHSVVIQNGVSVNASYSLRSVKFLSVLLWPENCLFRWTCCISHRCPLTGCTELIKLQTKRIGTSEKSPTFTCKESYECEKITPKAYTCGIFGQLLDNIWTLLVPRLHFKRIMYKFCTLVRVFPTPIIAVKDAGSVLIYIQDNHTSASDSF